jgi:hypothetical protein
MQLIIHLDEQGLIKVDLSASSPLKEAVHRFFEHLRPAIEKLGTTAQEVGREIESGEDEAR